MGIEVSGLLRAAGPVRPGAIRLAVVAGAIVALLGPAAPVRAAALTFGVPTASSSFGKGIDFAQPVSGGAGVRYVDIVIDYPGATGPAATQVDTGAGSGFEYHLDTSKGQMVPNTTLTAHWRVTLDDGTQQDGPAVTVTYADTRFHWQSKSGNLVRLHWYQGDDAFAQRALQIGEQGVEHAASFMGVQETKPIDFFVYADQQSFYDALGPGTRENVGGEAHTDIRTLFALITPDEVNQSWVGVVIPHELTHVVFDDVVHNPYHEPPHWLNEGVAVYLTQGYDSSDQSAVEGAVGDGSIMPLDALRGQFPTVADRFNLGYSESVSAVDFMVRKYGKSALVKLIDTYGEGVSDDAAFKAATGLDSTAFDDVWLASVGASAPKQYGPAPAPTGPLPPGWSAAGGAATAAAGAAAPTSASGASATPVASPNGRSTSSTKSSGENILLVVGAGLLIVVGIVVFFALGSMSKPERRKRQP